MNDPDAYDGAVVSLLHCGTHESAESMRSVLRQRPAECGLELHPKRMKVVCCRDSVRVERHPFCSFDFSGYTFRPRGSRIRQGRLFVSFSSAVSRRALASMTRTNGRSQMWNWTQVTIDEYGRRFNTRFSGLNRTLKG